VIKRSKGSALVQGVVGLWLLVIGTLLGLLLLVNVGGATYGREKLGFVADQAAGYATTLPAAANRQQAVTDLVKLLLAKMGFSTTNTTVTVSDTTVNGQAGVQVTVTTSLATLLAGNFGGIIPGEISMPYTAAAAKTRWFNSYAVCTLLNNQSLTNPVIDTNMSLPKDGLPHYSTNILGTFPAP
jgi:Flp pilus assembly protein TadG